MVEAYARHTMHSSTHEESNSRQECNRNCSVKFKNKNLYFSIIRSSWSNNINGSNNIETNFSKGSLIELANGELKRVEDMRAEDFITSSNKNPSLQLADTTVVKLSAIPDNKVVITFVYNNNKVSSWSISYSSYIWIRFFPYTLHDNEFEQCAWVDFACKTKTTTTKLIVSTKESYVS